MFDIQNEDDAFVVSGSTVIRFWDQFTLMRNLLIRRLKTILFATSILYSGIVVFVLVRDNNKYVENPGNIVPLVLGFFAWMPLVIGCGLLIGLPVLLVSVIQMHVSYKRLRQTLGSDPIIHYTISNDGLSLKDSFGFNSFAPISEIDRINFGRKYLVFIFKRGGLRLLPLRDFSHRDITVTKAIARKLIAPRPAPKSSI